MWNRIDLKMRGKAAFKKNYWSCVLVALILSIIAGVGAAGGGRRGATVNSDNSYSYFNGSDAETTALMTVILMILGVILVLGVIFAIFIGNLLVVGGCQFFVENQTDQPGVGRMLSPFKSGHYGNVVLTMFLRDLFTFLWSLLLIIPGIIKSYEYRMIPYILGENPGMSYKEAFAISRRMMTGKKWDTFVLDLSFIGWWILGTFTCGILGIFYVAPYVQATDAEIYTANKKIAYQEGYIK